jgi:hypothetical protein
LVMRLGEQAICKGDVRTLRKQRFQI